MRSEEQVAVAPIRAVLTEDCTDREDVDEEQEQVHNDKNFLLEQNSNKAARIDRRRQGNGPRA